MTARYSVVIDPLGMANVVSDREPGPGRMLHGQTGEWYRVLDMSLARWATWDDAVAYMRGYNATHSPARPGEGAG